MCANLSGKLVNLRLHACPTFFQCRCLDQIISPPDYECPRLTNSLCTISLHAMTQRPSESLLDLPLHFAFRTVDTCTFNIKKKLVHTTRHIPPKVDQTVPTFVYSGTKTWHICLIFFSTRGGSEPAAPFERVGSKNHTLELLSTIDTTTCNTSLSLQAWSLPRRTNVPDEDEHCGRLLFGPLKVEIGSLTLCSSFAGYFRLLTCQPAPSPK